MNRHKVFLVLALLSYFNVHASEKFSCDLTTKGQEIEYTLDNERSGLQAVYLTFCSSHFGLPLDHHTPAIQALKIDRCRFQKTRDLKTVILKYVREEFFSLKNAIASELGSAVLKASKMEKAIGEVRKMARYGFARKSLDVDAATNILVEALFGLKDIRSFGEKRQKTTFKDYTREGFLSESNPVKTLYANYSDVYWNGFFVIEASELDEGNVEINFRSIVGEEHFEPFWFIDTAEYDRYWREDFVVVNDTEKTIEELGLNKDEIILAQEISSHTIVVKKGATPMAFDLIEVRHPTALVRDDIVAKFEISCQ